MTYIRSEHAGNHRSLGTFLKAYCRERSGCCSWRLVLVHVRCRNKAVKKIFRLRMNITSAGIVISKCITFLCLNVSYIKYLTMTIWKRWFLVRASHCTSCLLLGYVVHVPYIWDSNYRYCTLCYVCVEITATYFSSYFTSYFCFCFSGDYFTFGRANARAESFCTKEAWFNCWWILARNFRSNWKDVSLLLISSYVFIV